LWNFETKDGRSIRRALEYLYPFAIGEQKWSYQQLGEWPPQSLFPLMRRAAERYKDEKFRAMMSKIPALESSDRSQLIAAG
jgi:hypothetical protein